MRKKIVLSYEETTGTVYDAAGLYIGTNLSLQGFTTDEIIELKRKELI